MEEAGFHARTIKNLPSLMGYSLERGIRPRWERALKLGLKLTERQLVQLFVYADP